MKDCYCSCKEIKKGPEAWQGLTNFRIAELDVLRGYPGRTDIGSIMAKDVKEAIKKYYESNPGASDKILIYPEGCANLYQRNPRI
jgi:hypothetical protein